MYRKFYGLAEPPFNLTPDSRFLFLSKRHREALAAVLYGIDQQKGFIVLTGAIGAGKTTICRALLMELDKEGARVAVILNSFLNELELLQAINDELGLPSDSDSRKVLVDALNRFLLEQRAAGHTVVVVIDEAQHLSRESLEQIRMLSNLETEKEKLIQIVLIGQPELDEILRRPDLEQLNQRVTVRYHLTALSAAEMAQYIRHRLTVARARIEIEFLPETLQVIYDYSQGVPRKINLACDRALLAGYADGVYVIEERLARRAVAELEGDYEWGEAEAQAGSKEQGASSSLPVLIAALTLFALLCVGGAIGMGFLMAGRQAPPRDMTAIEPTATPTPSAPAARSAKSKRRPKPPNLPPAERATTTVADQEAAGDGSATSEPAAASAARPRIRTPDSLAWVFQERDIMGYKVRFLQVTEERHALAGAFLTLLDAWGQNADMEPLREGGEDACRRLIARYAAPGKEARIVPLNNMTLIEALDYDIPLLLELDDSPAATLAGTSGAGESLRMAPYAVLLRAQGEALTVADPFSGLRTVRLGTISRYVAGITALYLDPHRWSALAQGEESEAALTLQQFLHDNQWLPQRPSGAYDAKVERAIKLFQSQRRLEQTGELDTVTLLLLATQAYDGRPRLFPSERERQGGQP